MQLNATVNRMAGDRNSVLRCRLPRGLSRGAGDSKRGAWIPRGLYRFCREIWKAAGNLEIGARMPIMARKYADVASANKYRELD